MQAERGKHLGGILWTFPDSEYEIRHRHSSRAGIDSFSFFIIIIVAGNREARSKVLHNQHVAIMLRRYFLNFNK